MRFCSFNDRSWRLNIFATIRLFLNSFLSEGPLQKEVSQTDWLKNENYNNGKPVCKKGHEYKWQSFSYFKIPTEKYQS